MKIFILIAYLTINVISLAIGVQDADFPPYWSNCHKELRRIEYLVPGYQVGCWLGRRSK